MSISQTTDPAPHQFQLKLSDSVHIGVSAFGNLKATLNTNGTLTLYPEQVLNVYTGLKQGEVYKSRYADAIKVVDSLTNIVEQQDYNLNQTLDLMKEHDAQIKQAYENMPVVWYKSPYLYGTVGLLIGILIAK